MDWPIALNDHVALAAVLLIAGLLFWLGDAFLAERADIHQQTDIANTALDVERKLYPEDHNERRLLNGRRIRTVGKVVLALGVVAAATLLWRLAA